MKVSRLRLGTMNFACQTSEQDCFRMMDEALDKKLDEIFPGPGGEAPKAYAW